MKSLMSTEEGKKSIKEQLMLFEEGIRKLSDGFLMAKIDLHDNDLDIKIHCLKCQASFRPSHSSDRIMFSSDILDESHQHFRSTRHTNSTKPKMKTKTLESFFKKSLIAEIPPIKTPTKKNCKGFGIKIGLNFRTGFSGKHYSVGKKYGEESAWAIDCEGTTKNPSSICDACEKKLKCPTVIKKAQRIQKSDGKVSRFTPHSFYPEQARTALSDAAKMKKCQARKIRRLEAKNEEIGNVLQSIQDGKFSHYIQSVATRFRKDSGETLTKASLQIADDLVRNAQAASKYGYRHDAIFQALSTLVFNNCQSSLRLLHKNLPMIFVSPSRCAQIRRASGLSVEPLPGVNLTNSIREHFMKFGWVRNGKVGPLQFCHDSVRIRELVKPNTKIKILIGFVATKNIEGNFWQFYTQYQSLEDIKNAFLTQNKAGYALLGLITALQEGIPPVYSCIIPHDNKFSVADLQEWVDLVRDDWVSKNLPITAYATDFDSKNLSVLEKLTMKQPSSIGLHIEEWLVHGNISDKSTGSGLPLAPIGDSRHGLKLARTQILYVDKFLPSPCGVVVLQFFENARRNLNSGLTKRTVNPADKQDVDEAMAFVSERARRIIYQETRNLATSVYTFIARTLYDIYNLESTELSISQKVVLCGHSAVSRLHSSSTDS